MTQKQNLSAIELDEVSLVDSPACPGAHVILMKRADQEDVDKAAPAGIKFNLGFPEGDGGSEVQSVIFDSKLWDAERAKKWLKDHDMVSEKVDETANTLRFRQKDPAGFKRFRVITPGKAVSKALKAKDSYQRVTNVVDEALRNEFAPKTKDGPMSPLWIRDLYKDSAVFDQDGQTYRVDYSVDRDENSGELKVTLGEKVPVEVVYQDVKKSDDEEPPPAVVVGVPPKFGLSEIPEELERRVLKFRMDVLKARLRKSNSCHVPSGPAGGQFCETKGGGSGAGSSGVPSKAPKMGSGKATIGKDHTILWNQHEPVVDKFATLYQGKMRADTAVTAEAMARGDKLAAKFHEQTKEVSHSGSGFAGSGRTVYEFQGSKVFVDRSANGKGFYGTDHHIGLER